MNRKKTTIGLMRHGQAGSKARSDFDRPLTSRGVADVKAVAMKAAAAGFLPPLIITSAAERARQTAEVFRTTAAPAAEIIYENDLYLCPPETIWRHIASAVLSGFDSILLVGHNPGISQTAATLGNHASEWAMSTADLFIFESHYDKDTLASSRFCNTAAIKRPPSS